MVGKGSERARLEARAGETVRFFGHVSEAFLWECYRRCRALLFPGIEDFGIVPVECLSSGRPVIAIQAGGVAETVDGESIGALNSAELPGSSGVLLPKSAFSSVDAFVEGIRYFIEREQAFDPDRMRRNAQRFEYAAFFGSWRRFAEKAKISVGSRSAFAEEQGGAATSPISLKAV